MLEEVLIMAGVPKIRAWMTEKPSLNAHSCAKPFLIAPLVKETSDHAEKGLSLSMIWGAVRILPFLLQRLVGAVTSTTEDSYIQSVSVGLVPSTYNKCGSTHCQRGARTDNKLPYLSAVPPGNHWSPSPEANTNWAWTESNMDLGDRARISVSWSPKGQTQ